VTATVGRDRDRDRLAAAAVDQGPGAAAPELPRLSAARQAVLSAFWFSINAQWIALLLVAIPSQVVQLVGDAHKGAGMALVIGLGAIVPIVVQPLVGALSDGLRSRFGRRRPFVVAGTLVACVGLLVMMEAGSLTTLFLGYLVVQLGSNAATAPYAALIPDVVPESQRGAASGWMGLMTMLGNLGGALAAGLLLQRAVAAGDYPGGLRQVYLGIAALQLVGALVTVLGVRERPVPAAERLGAREFLRRFLVNPRRYPDFAWVFATRFLFMLGLYTVQGFLLFYLRDVVGSYTLFGAEIAKEAEGAVSVVLAAILLGAVASTFVAGALSDRVGRKRVVYASGGLMALVAGALVVSGSFAAALALGLAFGVGYGAYIAVDWALGCDVLPSKADAARYLGVWSIATTLPQLVAVPIAGPLLDRCEAVRPGLGYAAIFGIALVYFVVSTILISRVRGAR